jgi:hypothetical protein
MTGMTGSVPYYGGRFTPAQAYAASHAVPPPPPPAPTPAPTRARPPEPSSGPQRERPDPVAALDELLESGVITEQEHQELSDRLHS